MRDVTLGVIFVIPAQAGIHENEWRWEAPCKG